MTRVILELNGGPFDGATIDSESLTQQKEAMTLLKLARSFEKAKEQEVIRPVESIRRFSPDAWEMAVAERWSHTQMRAVMPFYYYRVTDWYETGGELLVVAHLTGHEK